jgi:hypothetical protein
MKIILMLLALTTFSAHAARIECTTNEHKFTVVSNSPSDLRVTFMGETVVADGMLDQGEIDFVARFVSIGEMTLVAKIGEINQKNYAFIKGRRISVICR